MGLRKLRSLTATGALPETFAAEYDGGGMRARSTRNGVTTTYSFGLLEEASGGGSTVYTPGISQRQNGIDRFVHADWIGSTRYLTDGTGLSAPTAFRFDSYGNVSAQAGSDATSRKYAGGHEYESDGPAGMQLLGHRFYDPALGRFLNPDPIGFAGGLNLYAYCENDPVGFVDPLGLWRTGSYLGDVGEVFKGYGDALNPVAAYQGARNLYGIARSKGFGEAAKALGQGIVKTIQGLGSDDPRTFGSSTMSALLVGSPLAKRIKAPAPVRTIARRIETYAVAPAVALVASRGGTLGQSSFACNQMSRSMSRILGTLEVQHDVLYTTFPQPTWLMTNGRVLTNSGAHFSVRVGGRVFDTATGPAGRSFTDWVHIVNGRGNAIMEARPGGSSGAFYMPNPLK